MRFNSHWPRASYFALRVDTKKHSAAKRMTHEVAARLRALWLPKALGLAVGITAFFAAYFQLLNQPAFPVTIMPLTAVDRWVGFQPAALPLYASLWVYVPLAFVLLRERRELAFAGAMAALLSVIGLGIFFFWPTAVPALPHDWSAYPAFAFLKSVDASGNACPSLHVAFAVFTALHLGRILRALSAPRGAHVVNWLWCTGIAYSTLATAQHVFVDVLAGVVLGAAIGALRLRR